MRGRCLASGSFTIPIYRHIRQTLVPRQRTDLNSRCTTVVGYPGIQKVLPDKWVVNISHSYLESNSKIVINTVAFLHTCVAHAKTFAHGYVQPAAWNIGRILHFFRCTAVPTGVPQNSPQVCRLTIYPIILLVSLPEGHETALRTVPQPHSLLLLSRSLICTIINRV